MVNCIQRPITINGTSRLHGCHHAAHDNTGDPQSDSMNRALTFLFPKFAACHLAEAGGWEQAVTRAAVCSSIQNPSSSTTQFILILSQVLTLLSARFLIFLNKVM